MASLPIHAKHRERLRARYLKDGLAGFAEHEVLELLLFYAIPRYDTNIIAHRLLERFESLPGVIGAPAEMLVQVEGIGKSAAVFFSLLHSICSQFSHSKTQNTKFIQHPHEAVDYLRNRFFNLRTECVFMLAFDAKRRLLFGDIVHYGSLRSVEISLRTITQIALSYQCHGVVLAHNHPSGSARPSPADINITSTIDKSLAALGIDLIDHIIITDDGFVSLAQKGYLSSPSRDWAEY